MKKILVIGSANAVLFGEEFISPIYNTKFDSLLSDLKADSNINCRFEIEENP